MLTAEKKMAYLSILREELVPATGCTEPIALAYASARLRDILGTNPERIRAEVSGNIIKNVKSVVVPNSGGLKGICAAIAAGIIAGAAERALQVISSVPAELHETIAAYSQDTPIEIACADTTRMLDIRLTGWAGEHFASVHIANSHSNIVREERDGEVLLEKPVTDSTEDSLTDKSVLNVADILDFANTAELEEIAPLLRRQIDCNTAIAEEGLQNDWGANIGSVMLAEYPSDIKTEARAWAAAGSDARMSGQPGHHRFCTGGTVRQTFGHRSGETVPGAAGQRPGNDPPEKRHRPTLRLLRRSQRGGRGRGRDCLSAGRQLRSHCAHHRQRCGYDQRHHLRRGKALLRRQDRCQCGRRAPGLFYVQESPGIQER